MEPQETAQNGKPLERDTVKIPSLAGVSARMRVDVEGDSLGTIVVERGRVWLDRAREEADVVEADVVAVVHDEADFRRMLGGDLNPVVAVIQGRIVFRGNPALATRIILALNAVKPFGLRLASRT